MIYDVTMTLSNRNYFFKGGILLSLGAIVLILAVSARILPLYPDLIKLAARRSSNILQFLAGHFFMPAPYVPFTTMAAAAVYAFITIVLVYYFFEKTQAPEILFFTFFAFSFSFEAARIMVPLKTLYNLPGVYLVIASRILLFGRYFGILSLFAASVHAAGLEMQKQGNILLIIALATLVITLGVPIDAFAWDSSLNMISGYASMFRLVEVSIVLITMVSFIVSAYSRGSREYVFISAGALLVFVGRDLLIGADTWISPLPGLLILTAGTWIICNRLRRVYLWL
jgi:hypothetical protein